MIETFDIVFRLVAVGASLMLLILLLAGEVRRGIKVALAGLLVGSMAYLVNSSLAFRKVVPYLEFADLASLAVPFWLWLFGRRLFEREPDPRLSWAVVAVMVMCWYAGNFIPWTRPVGFYTIHAVGLILVVDLVRVALAGREDDLIESRRMIRVWLPILVAAQSGGILSLEILIGDALRDPTVQLVNAILILMLSLFAGLALLQPDPELLVETSAKPRPARVPDGLSPSEQVLKEKLEAAMAERFYREPGLSIATLAAHLDTPEHRLRALINKGLGHRNFSAFLNGHRIDEARAILTDKTQVDVPVLTIAMDLGYNSLATFNRAFRAETGMTPTDYRREMLGKSTDQN